MSLKDFKPDDPDFDDKEPLIDTADTPIGDTSYHEEINTLKIDKLSNRVTIISVILPCIIGAILIFAYLDMKERVVDVDETKNTQVERISRQLDEKLNALDVKIAKNRFDLDKHVPEITDKQVALEGKLTKMASSKVDDNVLKKSLAKLEGRIAANSKQQKTFLKKLDTLKGQMDTSLTDNTAKLEKTFNRITEEITLFKEEFDARLLELSNYELQIGELRKDFSLIDKKFRRMEQEAVSASDMDKKINDLTAQFNSRFTRLQDRVAALDKKLVANISRLQKDLDLLISQSASPRGPQPQINADAPGAGTIEQKVLTE